MASGIRSSDTRSSTIGASRLLSFATCSTSHEQTDDRVRGPDKAQQFASPVLEFWEITCVDLRRNSARFERVNNLPRESGLCASMK
jgi:hypothetical protein